MMDLFAVALLVVSFLGLSLGQPAHHHGDYHHRVNRASVEKRDRITISDGPFAVPTELPEVVVYVDQYGNPIRTATETVVYIPKETLLPETSSLIPPPSPAVESASEPGSKQQPGSATPSASLASTLLPVSSTQPDTYPTQPSPSALGGSLYGVTYSPYKGNGNCKTADEVDRDFSLFSQDYGVVRIYGVDCDQVSTVSKAARKYGNKLFLGIFDINTLDSAVGTMAADLDYDWSVVDAVSIGNELVNNGGATVEQSLAALNTARSCLRAAGYEGPVVIVDTFVAVLAHPELCDQSDYCAVNVHPFFDHNTPASEAGPFVDSIVQNVRSKLSDPSKRIVVTETGWPWQGQPNGVAIPSLDQQSAAISSIKGTFADNAADLFLFTAFNDLWKKPEAGTFMAEQFWGMGGRYSPCDE
ncbi:putative cell wall glucanase [Rosellinia necatrix]|uniref:Putative cell wall glucanase n=1 Tax=Rosellinia necatrix TaxID=77044 RepID=A0A1S7UP73_ROSNE|nr:putative cell wall glucanase [Rosellinia necatrix]